MRRDPVDAAQNVGTAACHHDDMIDASEQALEHRALRGVGPFEHGVERGDDRQAGRIEQIEDMRSGVPAEDAIFVLEPDRPRAALLDSPGGIAIVGDAVEMDRLDLVGVRHVGPIIDRIMVEAERGIALAQRIGDMAGEGRKPALARQRIADDREATNGSMPRNGGDRL